MQINVTDRQFIFQEKKEVKRLHIQNRLFSDYEKPIFEHIFFGRKGITVLDIGCNDGTKTIERFSSEAVSRVIGLEYNSELALNAQKKYGNNKFSFYPFDIEAPGFSERLQLLMEEKEMEGFDVIYMSLVLMHLSDMPKVLCEIRSFLKEDGHLVIIEAEDEASTLTPDKKGLLESFLTILKKDKYSGNRDAGKIVCDLLAFAGYEHINVWHEGISAGVGEKEKKKDIFNTFFSYLPEDVELLLEEEPDNEEYLAWADWLSCNYKKLRRLIVQGNSEISMGVKMVSCRKGEK